MILCSSIWAQDPILFVDANLKAVVEDELWIMDPTPEDMLLLTSLKAFRKGISNLEGLQYARNLESLNLRWNELTDISRLSGLTELTSLNISQNDIVDISVVSNLQKLDLLDMHENEISDISAVGGLTDLRILDLHCNHVEDLSVLSGLANLESLTLYQNNIADISPLSGLVGLVNLDLYGNSIRDVTAIQSLNELQYLRLDDNSISDISPLSGLQNIRTLCLNENQIESVAALGQLKTIYNLDIHHNAVHDLEPIVKLKRLLSLDVRHNPLNRETYCTHIQQIMAANPGVDIRYSPNMNPPTSVSATDGLTPNHVDIAWEPLTCGGDSPYYQVLRSMTLDGSKTPISPWQTAFRFQDTTAIPEQVYYYWVQTAASPQSPDIGPCSVPDSGYCSYESPLHVLPAVGGSVLTQQESDLPGDDGGLTFDLQAVAIDSKRFVFDHWSGTAVDAGWVAHTQESVTWVTVRGSCTLRAHFLALSDTLHVDAAGLDNAYADGTEAFPLNSIQQGIDVAAAGAHVLVRPGYYPERLHFNGRDIVVSAYEITQGMAAYPVIDAQSQGAAVTFDKGETDNCCMNGFVICGGSHTRAGGILCIDSHPTISHCLIVGNRAFCDSLGAGAILCQDAPACFFYCTIADNASGGLGAAVRLIGSDACFQNTIVHNSDSPAEIAIDPNSLPTINYSSVRGGWPGAGNLEVAPSFISPGYWADANRMGILLGPCDPDAVWHSGDYHLKSAQGRWNPDSESWQQDEVTSLCIDAGDPAESPEAEQMPNGDVVNIGAYGSTAQASFSQ
jgi:internalin A